MEGPDPNNFSRALSGSVKREKEETFSFSFLAVTLNFYEILAAPNFIYILGKWFPLQGERVHSYLEFSKTK